MLILLFMNPGSTKRQLQQVLQEVTFLGIECPLVMEARGIVFRRVLLWENIFSRVDPSIIFAILHKMAGTDYVKVLGYKPTP